MLTKRDGGFIFVYELYWPVYVIYIHLLTFTGWLVRQLTATVSVFMIIILLTEKLTKNYAKRKHVTAALTTRVSVFTKVKKKGF